ncbi:MAG: T9SS type A sorting domain-containing protein, partial [Bacteroidetes bacterium]|nr:T9SS type A sorting domain-containing protein [Bacteroidota bacterium]
ISGFNYLVVPSATSRNDTILCSGSADTLVSSAPHNNQWYRNDTLLVNDTARILIVRSGGIYSVAGTLNGVTTPMSQGIHVTVIPTPPIPLITADSAGLLSSDVSGNQWYKDTTAITGATGQRYKPSGQGDYSVKVTVNGCSSPFSAVYDYMPPVPTTSVNNSIYYSPNPMGNFLTLKFDPIYVTGVSVELYDLNGNRVLLRMDVSNGDKIDVSGLMPGVYVIRIRANNGQITIVNKLLKL